MLCHVAQSTTGDTALASILCSQLIALLASTPPGRLVRDDAGELVAADPAGIEECRTKPENRASRREDAQVSALRLIISATCSAVS